LHESCAGIRPHVHSGRKHLEMCCGVRIIVRITGLVTELPTQNGAGSQGFAPANVADQSVSSKRANADNPDKQTTAAAAPARRCQCDGAKILIAQQAALAQPVEQRIRN